MEKIQIGGGIFLTHTVYVHQICTVYRWVSSSRILQILLK